MFEGTVADNIRFGRPTRPTTRCAPRQRQSVPTVSSTRWRMATKRTSPSAVAGFVSRPTSVDRFRASVSGRPRGAHPGRGHLLARHPERADDPAALATVLAQRTAVVNSTPAFDGQIADRVLVLDHGRIVEDGPPAELVRSDGRYAALHRAWSRFARLTTPIWPLAPAPPFAGAVRAALPSFSLAIRRGSDRSGSRGGILVTQLRSGSPHSAGRG